MQDHIVVDIEIAQTIEQVGGWGHTDLMGVACAVVYEYWSDRYRIYGPDDVEELKERLLTVDRVTGYNTWRFDFPVIWGLPNRQRVKVLQRSSDDLLGRIWESLGLDVEHFTESHKGWGLDAVAKATLGEGKTGYGGDAPCWFQEGRWAKLVDYCIADVRLERKLSDFIDKYGFVVNANTKRVLKIKAKE